MPAKKTSTVSKIAKRLLKIGAWTIGILVILVVVLAILLQQNGVQNFVKDKAVTYLENKLKTEVKIGHIDIDFPKKIVLENIYLEDQSKDTLLYAGALKVDIAMKSLINNAVIIDEIDLENATAKLYNDSAFNFQYIVDAFVPADTSQNEQAKDTSSAPLEMDVNHLRLKNVRLVMMDLQAGNDMSFNVGALKADIDKFDINNYGFDIPLIEIANTSSRVKQFKPLVQSPIDTSDEAITLNFKVGKLLVSQLDLNYQNDILAISEALKIGTLDVRPGKIDLDNQTIEIESILLNDTYSKTMLAQAEQVSDPNENETTDEKGWRILCKQLNIANNQYIFDDNTSPRLKNGMDYAHMNVDEVNLSLNNFGFQQDSIFGNLADASFIEKNSSFKLQRLQTDFLYTAKAIKLENLYAKTNRTILRDKMVMRYNSLEQLTENIGRVYVNINLNKSQVALNDVLTFAPELASNEYFKKYKNETLYLNSKIEGLVKNLDITSFDLTGLPETTVSLNGKIQGLPDAENLFFDLNITEIKSTRTAIQSFAPKGTLPDNIELPERFALSGVLQGDMANINTNLALSSSYGSAKIEASLQDITDENQAQYDLAYDVNQFEVGKLIKQREMIGRLTAKGTIVGNGYNPETMEADVQAEIDQVYTQNYNYQNISFDGRLAQQQISGRGTINDPNAKLNFDAGATLGDEITNVNLNAEIDSVRLKELKLADETLNFHGVVDAQFESLDLDNLVGDAFITQAVVLNGDQQFVLDSISVQANADQSILIDAPFATAQITGDYKLSQIADNIIQHINKYYFITPVSNKVAKNQNIFFTMTVRPHPAVQTFLPDLEFRNAITAQGELSGSHQIELSANLPQMTFSGTKIDPSSLQVNSENDSLKYDLKANSIAISTDMKIAQAHLFGGVANNQALINVDLKDNENINQYSFQSVLEKSGDDFKFLMSLEDVLLNYQDWKINPSNYISFGPSGFYANNFRLSRKGQELSIQSRGINKNSPIDVNIKDILIETFTNFSGLDSDSLLLAGKVNGKISLENLTNSPLVFGDLNIDNLQYQSDSLGDLELHVNNKVANTYAVRGNLKNNLNNILIDGTYKDLQPSGQFNLDLDLDKLYLSTIENFTQNNIRDAEGFLTGDLKLSGTIEKPSVLGKLKFKGVKMNVAQLNQDFSLDNEEIVFKDGLIQFNQFTLQDSVGQKAMIDGAIRTQNYLDYTFDLSLKADDFQVMNSTRADNDLFWGELFISTNMVVKGDMESPKVDGTININEETIFSALIPQTDPGVASRDGVVEFVDFSVPMDTLWKRRYDSVNTSQLTGLNLAVNLEIDEEAEFNIIIDEANGDLLNIKGAAQLSAGIDPSGEISMTGNYILEEGYYDLTFNLIKRKFKIQPGSQITWTGQPTGANLDVTAIYELRTSPFDLVNQQLNDASAQIQNTYKQRMPFDVKLNMTGELLTPKIKFDIDLDEDNNTGINSKVNTVVETRLNQIKQEASELNKQVFALLILNRFIGEDPFSSSTGRSAEDIARGSVSKLLTEQLNQLAGNLVPGLDINVGIESGSDYTTGERREKTDLNLGLSKRLLNDRLTVSVNNNFELEGPQTDRQKTSGIAGNIQVGYMLTKDGRYQVNFFRRNDFNNISNGNVVETGASLSYTRDFDSFADLLRNPNKIEKDNERSALIFPNTFPAIVNREDEIVEFD